MLQMTVTALGEGARALPEAVVIVPMVVATVSGVTPPASVKVRVRAVAAVTPLQPAAMLKVKLVAAVVEETERTAGLGSTTAVVAAVPAVAVTVTFPVLAPEASVMPTVTGVGPRTVSQVSVTALGFAVNDAACTAPVKKMVSASTASGTLEK